ncbi:FadR/GntR family transcriptional regulator [Allomuricauda sp. CP2A]|jgi:GntR family transcriptional repressor for pyruvate dehydrogenase complex|uniref:FadR/GntR family transcriptional regulator n=1 Tax=Allomuricauda sp. CP2A TaxID=1848189 RepID=UPI00082BD630|nr:FadR/GntR family transcriptional regulator [Muricauda sp. CP2A]
MDLFQPIENRGSLSKHVENELTRAIRKGQYRPLQKLPTENELCSIFNVSRTVVREAIKGLNAKGIVEVKKGSGAYVSEMSIKNASETLNMFFKLSSDKDLLLSTIDSRAMIEPMIAARSAVVRTEDHLVQLNENIEKMKQCPLENKKEEAELDNQFHRVLLDCVDNPVLHLLVDPIFNLMPKFKLGVFAKSIRGNLEEEKKEMMHYHQLITDAIVSQDAQRAENFMREHLRITRENYMKTIKK